MVKEYVDARAVGERMSKDDVTSCNLAFLTM